MTDYMLAVHHEPGVQDAGAVYSSPADMERAVTAVAAFNEHLQSSGRLAYAGGLTPPEAARTVDATGQHSENPLIAHGTVSDVGPILGGFWIVRAETPDEALDDARTASSACGRPVELRPLEG
ncbi:MAG TPA: hypothetical protein DCL70_02020 [Kocuria sp.]|nr:hypothetical protein [Kocuria sp.]